MSIVQSSFVSHLEGAIDGSHLEPNVVQTLHEGRPIWVRYDLQAIGQAMDRSDLIGRPSNLWRYKELLPVYDESKIVSFGEGMSPLLKSPRLGAALGVDDLWVKDESQLPTGSFKSRGMAMAVTMANHFGIESVALPTAGNAGGAAAAYAARAGMSCYVFMPEDTPIINQYEAIAYGAKAYRVNGLINDCGRIVNEGKQIKGWFDLSTLKEPYRIEGKKTMGLELAEQLNWELPDAIFYPTGGGTGLIGMWKAFQELAALGWLENERMPRMFSVQSLGCAPIVDAFNTGEKHATPWVNAHSVASGIRVPAAVGDFMILDAVRESGGAAIGVEEDRIGEWLRLGMSREGISICPETGACIGAVEKCLEEGIIGASDRVVVFNTGAAQKYSEALECVIPSVDKDSPIDWNAI